MKKRFAACFLAACMLVQSLSISGYAKEAEGQTVSENEVEITTEETTQEEETDEITSEDSETEEASIAEELSISANEIVQASDDCSTESVVGGNVPIIYSKQTLDGTIITSNKSFGTEPVCNAVSMSAPIGLQWGDGTTYRHGVVVCKAVDGANGNYWVEIEKKNDNNEWKSYYHTSLWGWPSDGNGNVAFNFCSRLNEAGTYRFKTAVYTSSDIEDAIWSDYSSEYCYVLPSEQLGTPSSLKWDKDIPTKANWSAVEHAEGYAVHLYKKVNNEWKSVTTSSGYYSGYLSADFYREINDETEWVYSVEALSGDIEVYRNGAESQKSVPYNATNTSVVIAETLNDALNDVEINQDYESALDKLADCGAEELAVAMQSSASVKDLLEQLEDSYKDNNNIQVSSEADEAVDSYMDTNKISMVGAALNAEGSGSKVTLSVENPTVLSPELYDNAVQFSLSLSGVPNGGNLRFPIRITMPIPSNITLPERLMIVHLHQDGSSETIWPEINGDGTASFTITSFSDFVFAQNLGDTENIELRNEDNVIEKLELEGVDATAELTPYGMPENTVLDNVTWSSSNDEIISINVENNIATITALKKGCAVLTASVGESLITNCFVRVNSDDPSSDTQIRVLDNSDVTFWAEEIVDCIYTGAAIKPEPRVYADHTLLKKNVDYTLSWKNNINVPKEGSRALPTVTISGKGGYSGKITQTFNIIPKTLQDEDVLSDTIYVYKAKNAIYKIPTIKYGKMTLKSGKDFTVNYIDKDSTGYFKDAGEYTIEVNGQGNYKDVLTVSEVIVDKTVATLVSSLKVASISNQSYDDGNEIEPALTVMSGSKTLTVNEDYTVEYSNNTEVGTATATIVGNGTEYFGSKTVSFKIVGTSLSKAAKVGYYAKKLTYGGVPLLPRPSLLLKSSGEVLDSQYYDISYKNNENVGTASIIYTGKNGYSGTIVVKFSIVAMNLSDSYVRSHIVADTKDVCEYAKGGVKPSIRLTIGSHELVLGKDYTISYKNNTKLTTSSMKAKQKPYIEIKGKGNYTGKCTYSFNIIKQSLSKEKAMAPDMAYSVKSGKELSTPVITDLDGKTLKVGTDYDKNSYVYTVVNDTTLADNTILPAGTIIDKSIVVPAGTRIRIKITGKGNYTGTVTAEFQITTNAISKASVKIKAQEYTGKPVQLKESDFTITYGKQKTPLIMGTDYDIVSYSKNTAKGTATVVIRGKDNYSGTKSCTFTIKQRLLKWW